MAKFLNKKEQVIDFKLTPLGRRKLSTGKLNPTYYSFFDDGVIYDSKYAGFDESQNQIHRRIKNETSFLQGILSFEEIENSVPPGNYLEIAIEDTDVLPHDYDISPDKKILQTNKFLFDGAIGDAMFEGTNTQAAPAFKIVTCQGEIIDHHTRDTGKYDYTHVTEDNEAREFNIPQLEVELYYTKLIDKPTDSLEFANSVSDTISETRPFVDGYSIKLVRDDLVVYADEMNTELLTENFDIEVFYVNEEEGESKPATATIQLLDSDNGYFRVDDGSPVNITINDGINTTTFEFVADGADPETAGNVGVTIPTQFRYLGDTGENVNGAGLMYNLIAAIDDSFDNNYPTVFHDGSFADGSVDESGGRCTFDELHHPKCVVNSGANTLNVSVGSVPPPTIEAALDQSKRIITLKNLNLGLSGTITTNQPSIIKVTNFSGGASHKIKALQRKFFEREIPQIIDGLMVSETKKENLNRELTPDAVEYYFDVLTDSSVDAKIACECANTFNKNSYYIDLDFDEERCKEPENEIYFDIYGSVTVPEVCAPPDPTPAEECEDDL